MATRVTVPKVKISTMLFMLFLKSGSHQEVTVSSVPVRAAPVRDVTNVMVVRYCRNTRSSSLTV